MAPLVDWESLGGVDDVLGVLGVDRVVPIVVRVFMSWVERRVNEEDDVLVVRGK